MSKERDFIRNFMAFLDTTNLYGINALNEAVKICTKSKFITMQSLIDQMVSDCRKTNDAKKFLKNYCGIDLDNDDTGAITGFDAGGSTVKTAESVVPEVGSLKIYTKDSFTTRGGTFKLGQSYSSLTESEKFIWHALYTWWIPNALDLIAESYGKNYNLNENVMTVYFKKFSDALASANHHTLNISTYYYGNIDTSNVNGSPNTFYLDRVISHELTHSVMFKNSSWSFPQFIMEGMAELTHGIDDQRKSTILAVAGNADSLKSALNVNDDSTGWTPAYAGGYMFLRYFAKQFSDLGLEFTSDNDFYANYDSKKTLNALGGNDNVNNFSSDKVKIYGADGNDKIYSSDSNGVTIDGGKGNDSIFSSENKKSKIFGGVGKDTIENVGNYVTLSGGSGNDSIKNVSKYYDGLDHKAGNYVKILGDDDDDYISNGGNNVTIDGGTGNDSVSNFGDNTTISGGAGKDSIYSKGNNIKISSDANSDTIENYYGSKVTILSGTGNDYVYSLGDNAKISGGTGNDSLSNSGDNVTISGGTGKDKIYSTGSKVTISGNNGNDSINSSSGSSVKIFGDSGNDTIYSYSSKVTITGGTGKDYISLSSFSAEKNVIQYTEGDGNDTIFGFNSDDTFHITKGSYSAKADGNDIILSIGKGFVRFNYSVNIPIKVKTAKGKMETVLLTYDNSAKNTVVSGSKGNDTISNSGSKVTISGNNGNDYINNSGGSNVKIYGGNGKDTIKNYYDSKVTISGGAGNDTIENDSGSKVKIFGDSGNDSIYSSGANVTITGGTGKDYISLSSYGSENNVIQYAEGDGNDTIYGFNSDDTFHITKGSYSAKADGNDIILSIGKGSVRFLDAVDTPIKVKTAKGKIETVSFDGGTDTQSGGGRGTDTQSGGGRGTDTQSGGSGGTDTQGVYIFSKSNNTLLSGTSKDDKISNSWGNYVTISSGAGNDDIYSSGNNVKILSDTGNDSILNNSGDYVTISSGSGNDSIRSSGDNVTISSDTGDDTISSGGDNVIISSDSGNDSIYSSGDNVKISTSSGNDSIYSYYGKYVTINGGNGSDSINSDGGENVVIYGEDDSDIISSYYGNQTIYGGNGNDSIFSSSFISSANSKIYGGNGNDTIIISGYHGTTIAGGAGNDLISLENNYYGNIIQYTSGDGNDTISGFKSGHYYDTLEITGGSYSTVSSGDDLVVKVGSGSITLKNVGTQNISIQSSATNQNLWLFEENNFVSSDNLSSILENSSASTAFDKIEIPNFENLIQKNNVVISSKK